MSIQTLLLTNLTFADLVALRENFKQQIKECEDTQGIPKIDSDSISKTAELKEEILYLDRYILGKYKKVKSDSLPPKS